VCSNDKENKKREAPILEKTGKKNKGRRRPAKRKKEQHLIFPEGGGEHQKRKGGL